MRISTMNSNRSLHIVTYIQPFQISSYPAGYFKHCSLTRPMHICTDLPGLLCFTACQITCQHDRIIQTSIPYHNNASSILLQVFEGVNDYFEKLVFQRYLRNAHKRKSNIGKTSYKIKSTKTAHAGQANTCRT